ACGLVSRFLDRMIKMDRIFVRWHGLAHPVNPVNPVWNGELNNPGGAWPLPGRHRYRLAGQFVGWVERSETQLFGDRHSD
ncbi:MAG: hypothetical protein JW934_05500, partial [Anaerolineae bacterium]|nr:hypothetical protein [Anaerolineae bacterium]